MSIVIALLVFSFIVFIHELGHFFFARMGGIAVEEFAIGMGPKLLGFSRNGTEWTIRALPIGGFCRMHGEDGEDMAAKKDPELKGVAFFDRPVGIRIAAVFGGPLFNFILALVFSFVLIGLTATSTTVVNEVAEGTPAYEAGLLSGDKMISIDGHRLVRPREASIYINVPQGKPVDVVVRRMVEGEEKELSFLIEPDYIEVNPDVAPEESENYYFIGVNYQTTETSLWNILKYGVLECASWIKIVFYSLGLLITGQVSGTALSGPVALVSEISSGYEQSLAEGLKVVVANLSFWIVLISANLGVMNLLPIPALDGGRLVFLLIEAVTGKPLAPEKEGFIHFIGFALLMVLMVFVLYNDIARLLGLE